MREMSRSRLRERREALAVDERRVGEGGVRSESPFEVTVREESLVVVVQVLIVVVEAEGAAACRGGLMGLEG